jgi:hypothetical protein
MPGTIIAGITTLLTTAGVGAETAGILSPILAGAGTGAIESAATGQNILKGALAGGISGGFIGDLGPLVGSSLGIGATAGDALSGAAGGALGGAITGGNPLTGALTGGVSGAAFGPPAGGYGGSTAGAPTAGGTSAVAGTLPGAGGGAPDLTSLNSGIAPVSVTPQQTLSSLGASGGGAAPGGLTGGSTVPISGVTPAGASGGGSPIVGTGGTPGGDTSGYGLVGRTLRDVTGQGPGQVAVTPQVTPAQAAAAPTGGVNGILNSLGVGSGGDALKTITQGLSTVQNIQQNQALQKSEKALMGQATGFANQGAALSSYLFNGTLPPGAQAAVDTASRAAKARTRSTFASLGLSGSTAESDALNQVDQQAQAQVFQMADSLLAQGINESGLSAELYKAILGFQTQQNSGLSQAIANFSAASTGSGVGQKPAGA